MKVLIIRTIVFVLACTATGLLNGQIPSGELPKVYASFTETFDANKTYPAVCFRDAWQGADGRLWIVTCGPVMRDRLKLFAFDGHEFRLVKGVIDRLPRNAGIAKRLKDHIFVGQYTDADKKVLCLTDLHEQRFDTFPMLSGIDYGPVILDTQTVANVFCEEDAFVVHTLKQGKPSISRIDLPENVSIGAFDSARNATDNVVSYYDGKEIWWAGESIIYKMDITTGIGQSYRIQAGIWEESVKIQQVDIRKLRDKTFCHLNFVRHEKLLILDATQKLFIPVEDFGDGRFVDVFADSVGNVMYFRTNEDRSHTVWLQTPDNDWRDFSPVFTSLEGQRVHSLISVDFFRNVVVCHSGGLALFEISTEEAIYHALPNYSIRAMTMLGPEEVLVTTQSPDNFVVNTVTGTVSDYRNSCNISNQDFLTEYSTPRWIGTQTGLALANADLSACEYVFDDIGPVARIARLDDEQLVITNRSREIFLINTRSQSPVPLVIAGEHINIPSRIHDLYCSENQVIWLATSDGLWKFDLTDETTSVLGQESPFTDFRFICIDPSEDGRLWLGTAFGGIQIYDPVTGDVEMLDSDNGLASNTVVSITRDRDGVRWVGTYNGVSLVSPGGQLIANLYVKDGLVDSECNRYASLLTADGKVLIGTVNGLNVIDPARVKAHLGRKRDIRIYTTSIVSFDHKLREYEVSGLDLIDQTGQLKLPASRRSLSVSFALSNFFDVDNHQFTYLLEGRDQEWRRIGSRHMLEFDDLPPGHYTLRVRGFDASGNASMNALVIPFHARALLYEHAWFYPLLILVVVGLAILWIVRLRMAVAHATTKIRSDKLTIERQAEELKALDQAKSRFFTNISHEFRTPLTIITGMATQIIEDPGAWAKKGGGMIRDSSNTLLQLVNQILDLRKLESSEMQLQLICGDVIGYIRYLIDSFDSYVSSKGKQLLFHSSQEHLVMDYDPDKIMRIVSNLVSNAVKYTGQGTEISVRAQARQTGQNELFILEVEDNGPGIAEDKLPYLFDRFFQAEASQSGSGIGLALVRELTALIGGTVDVESKLGVGTKFVVALPVTRDAASSSAFTMTGVEFPQIDTGPVPEEEAATEVRTLSEDKPTVLVVEDHPDVMQLIAGCLEPTYHVLLAQNGAEGIAKAFETVPDLIISDLMMPEVDGLALCKTLKGDTRTNHIPIVLLTAKADMESKLSGLETGADDYLTKPFEPKELQIRLENLLENRRLLQERYTSGTAYDQALEDRDPQESFLAMVTDSIQKHIDDENFGVMHLCREVHLGRTQLHNKLKALTGMSTTIFIRHVRLVRARELLMRTSDLNISEVSYAVGFSDPKYFSRVYTDKFGEPPSQTSGS